MCPSYRKLLKTSPDHPKSLKQSTQTKPPSWVPLPLILILICRGHFSRSPIKQSIPSKRHPTKRLQHLSYQHHFQYNTLYRQRYSPNTIPTSNKTRTHKDTNFQNLRRRLFQYPLLRRHRSPRRYIPLDSQHKNLWCGRENRKTQGNERML